MPIMQLNRRLRGHFQTPNANYSSFRLKQVRNVGYFTAYTYMTDNIGSVIH